MIRVLIPFDEDFMIYRNELEKLYLKCQNQIHDDNTFDFIINNTFFYLFLTQDNKIIGAIYYFLDENKRLFLNGFAYPKKHLLNLECLKLSTTWFNGNIYAKAQNKASVLCLLKCGFIRIKKEKNIFVLHKKS